jgi:hypothetical protein
MFLFMLLGLHYLPVEYYVVYHALPFLVHWLLLVVYVLWRLVIWVRRVPVGPFKGEAILLAPTVFTVCLVVGYNLWH